MVLGFAIAWDLMLAIGVGRATLKRIFLDFSLAFGASGNVSFKLFVGALSTSRVCSFSAMKGMMMASLSPLAEIG